VVASMIEVMMTGTSAMFSTSAALMPLENFSGLLP
jgi:hypothetical protein